MSSTQLLAYWAILKNEEEKTTEEDAGISCRAKGFPFRSCMRLHVGTLSMSRWGVCRDGRVILSYPGCPCGWVQTHGVPWLSSLYECEREVWLGFRFTPRASFPTTLFIIIYFYFLSSRKRHCLLPLLDLAQCSRMYFSDALCNVLEIYGASFLYFFYTVDILLLKNFLLV